MVQSAPKYLSGQVTVAPRFQRAIRIDADLDDGAAIKSYICPESARNALLTMAHHFAQTGQGAFTWTGPYGGGKSSLALLLSAFLGRKHKLRKFAEEALGKKTTKQLQSLRKDCGSGRTVVPIIGSRTDLEAAVMEALPGARRNGKRNVVAAVEAWVKRRGSLVFILDEMGKFLEYAAHESGDVFLLQQLAEAASRSKGQLLIVGILHQSFSEYASRLGFGARDEWAKVQGRFVDIPVSVAGDEQIALMAKAIDGGPGRGKGTSRGVQQIADVIHARRPGTVKSLTSQLAACWPLHPVSACLLGPIANRRFGQNQRSIFGFLSSAEPGGFQDFLHNTPLSSAATYTPDKLWDYLRANLEPAILASPDGHRWSIALEAVARSEGEGDALELCLAKSAALIDLFGKAVGLLPDEATLQTSVPAGIPGKVGGALRELCKKSILIHKRHLGAYAPYAGSDFDIEGAMEQAQSAISEIDFGRLRRIAQLQPVIAKRHYYKTGTLRWFDVMLAPVSALEKIVQDYQPKNGAMGIFVVAIPTEREDEVSMKALCRKASGLSPKADAIAIGLPGNAWLIRELARELLALEEVRQHRPELGGDAVARRELEARLSTVTGRLEEELKRSVGHAVWWRRGKEVKKIGSFRELTCRASEWADEVYGQAPIIHNELLNRTRPSPNAVAARRALMRRMAMNCGEARLGIEGFPAEGGLFASILERPGLYRQKNGAVDSHGFQISEDGEDGNDPNRVHSFFEAACDLARSHQHETVSLERIYALWERPPYGIRAGLHPLFALVLMLAEARNLALYVEDNFQPEINDVLTDKLLQGPDIFKVRWVDLTKDTGTIAILDKLGDVLGATSPGGGEGNGDKTRLPLSPISIGRQLVARVQSLPPWTLRTTHLSSVALQLRDAIKRASDPNQLLFDDIPILLDVGDTTGDKGDGQGERDAAHIANSVKQALDELEGAYSKMLAKLRTDMLGDLAVDPRAIQSELTQRAANVIGITGDFRLDAFATRLQAFDEADETMAGVASLAANKPPRDWIDRDLDQAAMEIASLVQRFKRAELFARVKGRPNKRHALAVIIGRADGEEPLSQEFDVTDLDRPLINSTLEDLQQVLPEDLEPNIILAAMAELGARYIAGDGKEPDHRPHRSPKGKGVQA